MMTEAQRAQVAALHERMMRHCACQCDDDGNIDVNEMCLEHHYIVNNAMAAEREACVRTAERMLTYPDDNGGYGGAMAQGIAQAIRERASGLIPQGIDWLTGEPEVSPAARCKMLEAELAKVTQAARHVVVVWRDDDPILADLRAPLDNLRIALGMSQAPDDR